MLSYIIPIAYKDYFFDQKYGKLQIIIGKT